MMEVRTGKTTRKKAKAICFSKGARHETYEINFVDFSSVKCLWKTKDFTGWMQIDQLSSTLKKIDDGSLRTTQESIDLCWEESVILGGYGQISAIELRHRGLVNQFIAKNAREKRYLSELRNEWKWLKKITHDSIIKYIGFIEFQQSGLLPELVLILEKCCDENLKELISNAKMIYSMYTVVYWAKQLFSALDYLREKRLIHGDIKTKNILLTESNDRENVYDVKLCDFGVTVNKKESITFPVRTWEDTPKGTFRYMSPEAFECLVCHRSDIFCLGLVLWEMIERRNSYLDEKKKQREPATVCCNDNEELQKLIFDCTRISYKDRVKDAKFVLEKLEPMLKDYETRLNLNAEVQIEENETILRPPIGFDGTTVKGEYPRKPEPSPLAWILDDLESCDLRDANDFEKNDCNFYRRRLKEKFNESERRSQDVDSVHRDSIHREQAEFYSTRYHEIKFDLSKITEEPSETIDDIFKNVLLSDFAEQARHFDESFMILLEAAKFENLKNRNCEDLSPLGHLESGCWDLLELIIAKLELLDQFHGKFYSTNFKMPYSYDISTSSGAKTFFLLSKCPTGGLFFYLKDDQKALHYFEGTWFEEKLFIGTQEYPRNAIQSRPISSTDVVKWLRQERNKLADMAEYYYNNLLKSDQSEIGGYIFQVRRPPNHAPSCTEVEKSENFIPEAGFPKDVEWEYRIGRCKCVDSCAKHKNQLVVYTKIYEYLDRKLKIDFTELASVKPKQQKVQFYLHHQNQEKLLLLDHPKNYDRLTHDLGIHCINRSYSFLSKNIADQDIAENREKITVHDIFNESHLPEANLFFVKYSRLLGTEN